MSDHMQNQDSGQRHRPGQSQSQRQRQGQDQSQSQDQRQRQSQDQRQSQNQRQSRNQQNRSGQGPAGYSDQEVLRARKRKMAIRRKRRRQRRILIAALIVAALLLIFGAVMAVRAAFGWIEKSRSEAAGKQPTSKTEQTSSQTEQATEPQSSALQESSSQTDTAAAMTPAPDGESGESSPALTGGINGGSAGKVYAAQADGQTAAIGGDVVSSYAILVDPEAERIVASRNGNERISPASMTKILTVLVAAEQVTNLDDTFTITTDITDFSYRNDCSSAGFADGETVTVRDLFYGTILPSGGDAALALATYVAGSQEAFVELMNQKLADLGLSSTAHFTNCVGLYDDNHYCTAYDMAMILEAAADNELCKEILSTHSYTTTATEQHPEGITISNWFLRRIEDKDTHGTVLCAKTGYVVESGNCAASLATDAAGKTYICVTAGATSSWRCIYDHVAVYQNFLTGSGGDTVPVPETPAEITESDTDASDSTMDYENSQKRMIKRK